MDYRELLEKCNLLLGENRRLIKENDRLKAQLGMAERKPAESRSAGPTIEKSIRNDEPKDSASFSDVEGQGVRQIPIKSGGFIPTPFPVQCRTQTDYLKSMASSNAT